MAHVSHLKIFGRSTTKKIKVLLSLLIMPSLFQVPVFIEIGRSLNSDHPFIVLLIVPNLPSRKEIAVFPSELIDVIASFCDEIMFVEARHYSMNYQLQMKQTHLHYYHRYRNDTSHKKKVFDY